MFAAVRAHTGLSQLQLADLLDLSQSRISAVERGMRRLTHVKPAARPTGRLRIPSCIAPVCTGLIAFNSTARLRHVS
ncbi:helix-turn-helix domain-containing protein [Amycolatopsis tolypomycina]|uniref:helix-turn-helix domain-containing protein n=1 Tax=Amycolatopsis tolypomycina TaxID=208445 RepID=UPI0033B9B7F5